LKSLTPPPPEVAEPFSYAGESFTIAHGVPGFDAAYKTFGGEYVSLARRVKSFASEGGEWEGPTWSFAAGYKSLANS
jgi:hypothetical protein